MDGPENVVKFGRNILFQFIYSTYRVLRQGNCAFSQSTATLPRLHFAAIRDLQSSKPGASEGEVAKYGNIFGGKQHHFFPGHPVFDYIYLP